MVTRDTPRDTRDAVADAQRRAHDGQGLRCCRCDDGGALALRRPGSSVTDDRCQTGCDALARRQRLVAAAREG